MGWKSGDGIFFFFYASPSLRLNEEMEVEARVEMEWASNQPHSENNISTLLL